MIDKDVNDLAVALASAQDTKNTLTVAEFNQFRPLFLRGVDTESESYLRLNKEWVRRVSLYNKVVVKDGDKVVMELPPLFNRVESLSGEQGTALVGSLRAAISQDHPYRSDKERAAFNLIATVASSQSKDTYDRCAEEFAKLSDQVVGGVKPTDEGDGAAESVLEW